MLSYILHVLFPLQMVLAIFIQLIGATLFGFIVAATRRIMQFIGPIEKANNRNLQEIAVSASPKSCYHTYIQLNLYTTVVYL
jgi:hypothetical protein